MTFKTDSIIVGTNTDDTRNFLLDTDLAGALRIRRRSDGSGGTLISFNAAGVPNIPGMVVTQANQPTVPGGGGLMSFTHGLGAEPFWADLEFVCTTADAGYAIGDVISGMTVTNGSYGTQPVILKSATLVQARVVSGGSWQIPNKGTGANTTMTNASWAWRFKVRAA